jgi:hypothetical protein
MPRAAGIAVVAAVLAAARAHAGESAAAPSAPPSDGIALDVVGACPDAAAVRALLAGLLSPYEASVATVSIQDRGAQYRIAVRGSATTLEDPGRNCEERARRAAVVAASALQAPKVVSGPPVWTIEKGIVGEVAPTSKQALWSIGAEMRMALGSARWSLAGAAGARGPVTIQLDGDRSAELLRFPLDLGGRVTGYRWRLRPHLTLGGSATFMRMLGHDLVETHPEWRIGVGALALAGATLPVRGRIGVAAAIAVRWEPRPYDLEIAPIGKVGETPKWWLGLSLNYVVDGKPSSP